MTGMHHRTNTGDSTKAFTGVKEIRDGLAAVKPPIIPCQYSRDIQHAFIFYVIIHTDADV